MKLEVFKYILTVAEYQSFSKAAEALYISHPALSIAISNFEKDIGFQIFHRSTKGVRLNEKGQQVLAHIRVIQDEIGSIKSLSPSAEIMPLKIASISTISNNVMPTFFDTYADEYQNVRVVTNEMVPTRVTNAVLFDDYDIGLSFVETERLQYRLDFAKENNLSIECLGEDRLCLFANKENPLLKKSSVYENDLYGYTFLSMFHRHSDEKSTLYTNPVDAKYDVLFNSQEAMKQYIANSKEKNAIGYLPHLLSYSDYFVQSGAIVPLDVIDINMKIQYYLVYNPSSKNIHLIKPFIDNFKLTMQSILSKN